MPPAIIMPRTMPLLAACGLTILFVVTSARAQSVHNSRTQTSDFEFNDVDGKSIGLWETGKPVFIYNHGQMALASVRRAPPRSSYLHPIYGMDGEVLTDDFPSDHYHHHGLFWGWPHVIIGDREYDLWINRGIRIEFEKILDKQTDAEGARLDVLNGWYVRDKKVMDERATFHVHPQTDSGRIIDAVFVWTPTDESITLRGAEGKGYGGLTLRFAPRTDTVITTPAGRAMEDLVVAKLPWADLSAQFQGAPAPSGAALLIHPDDVDTLRHDWMTRDYGVLAAGWPGVEPQTLEPGESRGLRYRVWIHRGVPDVAAIEKQWKSGRPWPKRVRQ